MRRYYIFICLIISSNLFSQNTLFVNQNVQGGLQNGSNWTNAFTDLQQALAVALDGDSVWVAKGVYYPTSSTDRSISFVLKQGVKIYGGFIGTEGHWDERNFLENETILSGNIGNLAGFDNSYHVLKGEGIDSTTVLDGFVVTKGGANGQGDDGNGGGLLILPLAGIYLTCPIIQNCRFEHNYSYYGGGIYCSNYGFSQSYLNPIIRNCQFISNRASILGGGMVMEGPVLPGFPFVLEGCLFAKNACYQREGGGIFISKAENQYIMRQCVFENDTAKTSAGGGMYFTSGYEEFEGAMLSIDFCIFKDNIATVGGGLHYRDGGLPDYSIPPFQAQLTNSVFENNIATNGYGAAYQFLGYSKSNFFINVLDCAFIRNKANSYCITYVEGGRESKVVLRISRCKYIENTRYNAPGAETFPIIFGLGGSLGQLDAIIDNCLFHRNTGGISSVCSNNGGKVKTIINNCTFFDNSGYIINKSYYPDFDGINKYVETYVTNCVIWEPSANVWNMFADNNTLIQNLGGYHIDHCLLSLDSFTTQEFPVFGDHILAQKDPMFNDISNDDFTLNPCSPAVNTGNNLVVDTLGILKDIQGNPRVAMAVVDMGAYEATDSCITINNKSPDNLSIRAVLSPNPVSAHGRLYIKIDGVVHSNTTWQVRNALRRIVKSGDGLDIRDGLVEIEAPDAAGVYFLEIWDGAVSISKSFVVL
jgi:hypothetical protein